MVQVHHEEGAATHLGPEACVLIREDVGERRQGSAQASH
jgi:hypothetical protein